MKRVLITGAQSYIGTHIAATLPKDAFEVQQYDVREGLSQQAFSGFDAVVHVAGIAHRKETVQDAPLYQRVNCDLAAEAARMAKAEGVKQFVFFSSMSVYGLTIGRITTDTKPAPNTCYGSSKWQAEQAILPLSDDAFRIAVLRPPMIYGKGCRGNYPRLAALAKKLPFFPLVQNERSMLFIGTLCAFVQKLLESGEGGLFFPQNSEYVNTSDMVQAIACCHGKTLRLLPGFGWLFKALESRLSVVGKVFGTLTYDKRMSTTFADAGQVSFEQSIRQTEVET